MSDSGADTVVMKTLGRKVNMNLLGMKSLKGKPMEEQRYS
jgi:hypothetical protein